MIHNVPVNRSCCRRARIRSIGRFGSLVSLRCETEHCDAGISSRRVRLDVGEIQVECDQGALLTAADVDDSLVWLSAQILRDYRVRVMPRCGEERRQRG